MSLEGLIACGFYTFAFDVIFKNGKGTSKIFFFDECSTKECYTKETLKGNK